VKIQIRSGNTIYNTVENPAAVFDRSSGTLHRIGEREVMRKYLDESIEIYRKNGFRDIADDLVYMELPLDQEEIDRVFQITGYIKKLYSHQVSTGHTQTVPQNENQGEDGIR
jgi:ketopantoate reductase